MTEKTILKLKQGLTNADGSPAKDSSNQNLSQQELMMIKPSDMKDWDNLTVGITLIGLINNAKPTNIEEVSKLQRLLVKIRNKMLPANGEWDVEKQELLDLQDIFNKADPKTLNVNLHGQVYNILQDLLIQTTL